MTAPQPEPANVFISYSDQGARVATRLRDDLRRSGFPVWCDPAYPEPETNAVRRVLNGLKTADTFIALFAADSATCRRQSTEVAIALARHRRIHRFVALTASEGASVSPLMRPFVLVDVSTATAYQHGLSRVCEVLRTPSHEMVQGRLLHLQQLEHERASLHRVMRRQLREHADAAKLLASVFARLLAGAVSVGLSVLAALVIFQDMLGGRFAAGMAILVASLASMTVGFFHGMVTGRGDLSSASARPDVVQEAGR